MRIIETPKHFIGQGPAVFTDTVMGACHFHRKDSTDTPFYVPLRKKSTDMLFQVPLKQFRYALPHLPQAWPVRHLIFWNDALVLDKRVTMSGEQSGRRKRVGGA